MAEPGADGPADLIELGAVRGAYGVRGWMRIAPFAADGGVLEAVGDWWLAMESAEAISSNLGKDKALKAMHPVQTTDRLFRRLLRGHRLSPRASL